MRTDFGLDVFAAGLLVDALDERGRETVFLAKEDSDFFHKGLTADYADDTDSQIQLANVRD